MRPTGASALAFTVTLALIALGLLGCTSTSDGASNPSPSATTFPADEQGEVERAYLSAITAFEAALIDPTGGTDGLATWWADPALSSVRGQVNTWAGFGQALRYPVNSQRSLVVESVTIDGETATLTACAVDDGQVVDEASGVVLNDDTVSVSESAVLRRQSTGWVIAERSQLERREGAVPCAQG